MPATLTRDDTETIEHLDFEPPCSCRLPMHLPPCQRPATWMMVKRCGHTGFACDPCKAKINQRDRWWCLVCGNHWPSASEAIIELRRL